MNTPRHKSGQVIQKNLDPVASETNDANNDAGGPVLKLDYIVGKNPEVRKIQVHKE